MIPVSLPGGNFYVLMVASLACLATLLTWLAVLATTPSARHWLGDHRRIGTTVMTFLDRLSRKGAAERAKQGRGYLYRPAVSQQEVCELAFERLLDDFFSRSPQKLLQYVEERRLDAQTFSGNGSPHLDSALL